ncbi:MAG: cobalamin biosynthesis protein CobD [Nitrospirae bacterium]|nr:cobalamin biosynthesis protein CobD [Nitrospirota bacterium]MBF0542144.1 cobalamin biosynthesis protein CobD [Nitrospirota bacterium]
MTPLLLAFLIDLAIGDPSSRLHPIILIGRLISFFERFLRKSYRSHLIEILIGGIVVILVVGITYFISLIFINITNKFDIIISSSLIALAGSFTISTKSLCSHVKRVINKLDNLDQARKALSLIVGRDTKNLDKQAILRAAIETLSENASDGIIAPIFYFAIGGLPLAFAYKAINTLDSMIGYKNEKYLYFGKVAARLDDIANFIPSRITGLLLIVSSFILKIKYIELKPLNGIKIMFRDGQNHTSPNAGIPESAVAGIFGIRLGGPSIYDGKVINKPYIGDDLNFLNDAVILTAIKIVKLAAILGVLIMGSRGLSSLAGV